MDVGDLPPGQRADRYRALAVEQRELAASAVLPEIRSKHLELAALWVRLAEEAERRMEAAGADRWDPSVDDQRGADA